MDHNIAKLVNNIWDKVTKKLLKNHIRELYVVDDNKEIVIMMDNQATYNEASKNPHPYILQDSIRKSFGKKYFPTLRFRSSRASSEHENITAPLARVSS